MPLHRDSTLENIHRHHRWEVNNQAGLDALVPDALDIHKVAYKKDDDTYHVLKSVSPTVWVQTAYTKAKVDELLELKQDILTEGAFVDGDKTKLDNIEDGATADQTASEIKTAYESNDDTNALTDSLLAILTAKKVKNVTTDAVNDKLVITYTDDTVANLNINDIVTDVHVSGATLDATTNVLILTSTDGGADVTVNLSDFVNSGELTSALSGKADKIHNHSTSDITGLDAALSNLATDLSDKQEILVSGTNIKTINGTTLLGSGDMVIGSSNTVIDTFAGVISAVKAGHTVINNNNKLTNNITNYEIATIDTNYIIGQNSQANIPGGNLSKSSNLYILNLLITGQFGTYYTSADGITWTKRVNPFGSGSANNTVYVPVDTATSTYFVAAQSGNTTGYISADGVTWSSFTFSSPPNVADSNGSIFSFNGTLYIPDNSTATSFHRITTSYQGKTDYPACGRTQVGSGILAKTGVGVMMVKDQHGEAGYTFTSDMSTFTSHTFPFEVVMGIVLSNYYDFEKGAFVFISFVSAEAYTSTDLKTFTRSDINVYTINTANASINKYFSTGINTFSTLSTRWSDMTKYSSIALNLVGSCREKHRLMPNGNMPLAVGLRRNHTNNKTELVLLGKKFNWETDNVKFPVSYIKL